MVALLTAPRSRSERVSEGNADSLTHFAKVLVRPNDRHIFDVLDRFTVWFREILARLSVVSMLDDTHEVYLVNHAIRIVTHARGEDDNIIPLRNSP